MKRIRPHFDALNLSGIRPSDIVAFHASMEEKGLSKKTRRSLHSILTRMFSYAVELELLDHTPVKRSTAPAKDEHAAKVALTASQMQSLFTALPIRMKAFYLTLALTGIRSGEALGLKWADVDLAGGKLYIKRAIYRGKETTPKTSKSLRSRPMVEALRTALTHHRTMAIYRTPEDYVFASASGRPMNPDQLRETLQAALRSLGITFEHPRADGLHLLRHSSGSVVHNTLGGDLKTTQEWLGHSNSRITSDVYVHLEDGQQRRAAEAAERAIFQPTVGITKGQA